jgi:mono/diheme cytochrome c family protein
MRNLTMLVLLALVVPTAAARADRAADLAAYAKMCASCHGADGHGNAAKAGALKIDAQKLDLAREEARQMSRDEKRKVFTDGKGKMPGYGKKLAPSEIDGLLDHCLALSAQPPAGKPATPTAVSPQAGIDIAAAKALFSQRCVICHKADGSGNNASARYLRLKPGTMNLGRDDMVALSRDARRSTVYYGVGRMPGYGAVFKPAEIDLLVDYSMMLADQLRAKKKKAPR